MEKPGLLLLLDTSVTTVTSVQCRTRKWLDAWTRLTPDSSAAPLKGLWASASRQDCEQEGEYVHVCLQPHYSSVERPATSSLCPPAAPALLRLDSNRKSRLSDDCQARLTPESHVRFGGAAFLNQCGCAEVLMTVNRKFVLARVCVCVCAAVRASANLEDCGF